MKSKQPIKKIGRKHLFLFSLSKVATAIDGKKTAKDIAFELGLSEAYVHRLIKIINKLELNVNMI